MGLLNELQIEVNVELDSAEIDAFLDSDFGEVGNWVIEPLIPILKEYKQAMLKGCEDSAKYLADKARSYQELYIGLNGSVMSGRLLKSIANRKRSNTSYLIGTDILDHFYPLCVENGRKAVYPKNKKFLHWTQLDGKHVFAKKSNPAKPRPFVEPAYRQVDGMAEEIVGRMIANAIK